MAGPLDALLNKMKQGINVPIPLGIPGPNMGSGSTSVHIGGPSPADLAKALGLATAGAGAVAAVPAWVTALAGAGGLKSGVIPNPFGGGGGSDTTTYPSSSSGQRIGIGGILDQMKSAYGSAVDYANSQGGGLTLDDILGMLAASQAAGGSGRYDTPADTMNAETNRFSAETQAKMVEAQIADMMYQRTVDEANLALKRGDLELARQKFEDSKIWSARAADAADESNRLQGIGIQTNAYGKMGDLGLGALGVQNDAYSAAGGLTNQATGMQLSGLSDAGNLQLGGYKAQGDILGNAGALGVSNFSATEDALSNRANVQARGAENYSNLTNIIGSLLNEQNNLALQIATTPRNAIAGFLMGRGQNGGLASAFNPSNLLGINPQMLQGVINSALQSAAQVGVMPAMQPFDINSIIQGMVGAGNNAASSAASAAAGIRDVANAAPGRVANDVNALRQVGASAPGAIQGAVSGLSNAAASVANRVPSTVPAPSNTAAGYQATLNQMIAGGAPPAAIDMYRNNMASAGIGPA